MPNRLKELRLEKGLTLKEFAKSFNDFLKDSFEPSEAFKQISYATVSRWENGVSDPKRKMWEKLADYYGVSINYVRGDSNLGVQIDNKIYVERETSQMSEEQLANAYNSLIEKNKLPENKIDSTTISQWEKSYTLPENKQIDILADVLHVTPAYLIGFNAPRKFDSLDSQEKQRYTITSSFYIELIHQALIQNMRQGYRFEYSAYYKMLNDSDFDTIFSDLMLAYETDLLKYGKGKYKPHN